MSIPACISCVTDSVSSLQSLDVWELQILSDYRRRRGSSRFLVWSFGRCIHQLGTPPSAANAAVFGPAKCHLQQTSFTSLWEVLLWTHDELSGFHTETTGAAERNMKRQNAAASIRGNVLLTCCVWSNLTRCTCTVDPEEGDKRQRIRTVYTSGTIIINSTLYIMNESSLKQAETHRC